MSNCVYSQFTSGRYDIFDKMKIGQQCYYKKYKRVDILNIFIIIIFLKK